MKRCHYYQQTIFSCSSIKIHIVTSICNFSLETDKTLICCLYVTEFNPNHTFFISVYFSLPPLNISKQYMEVSSLIAKMILKVLAKNMHNCECKKNTLYFMCDLDPFSKVRSRINYSSICVQVQSWIFSLLHLCFFQLMSLSTLQGVVSYRLSAFELLNKQC